MTICFCIYCLSIFFKSKAQHIETKLLDLQQAYDFTPAEAFSNDHNGIFIKDTDSKIVAFRLPVIDYEGYKKIRVSLVNPSRTGLPRIDQLQIIFENSASAQKVVGDRKKKVSQTTRTYDIPLIKEKFDYIDVVVGSQQKKFNIGIERIELVAGEFADHDIAAYATALFLSLLLILPGALLYGLVFSQAYSNNQFLVLFFPLSILFYVALFCLIPLSHQFGLNNQTVTFTSFTLLTFFLLFANYRHNSLKSVGCYLYTNRGLLFLFALSLFLFTYYVSYNTSNPFTHMSWKSISGPKTFQTFSAHDNYFQYANGKVLQENLPFSSEYGDQSKGQRFLFYHPQDREMLPGILYASFRSLLSFIDTGIGKSYFTYSLFGIAANLMLIFPLMVFARRYVKIKSELLLLIIVFANAALISHTALTWFKLCGAGLFIAGIWLLLNDKKDLKSWLLAGLCFGLGTNMHPAVAIGIPLYFLWFVYQHGQTVKFAIKQWLSGPILLFLTFFLTTLPWKLIKTIAFPKSIALPVEYFFYGHTKNNSLLDSAISFFQQIPLNEQLAHRFQRLLDAFQWQRLQELYLILVEKNFVDFLFFWTKREFGFTVFLYYPLIAILIISLFSRLLIPKTNSVKAAWLTWENRGKNRELVILILLSISTQLAFIFATYTKYFVDLTWVQPLGLILIVMLGMIIFARQYVLSSILLICYAVFSYFRLYESYLIAQLY